MCATRSSARGRRACTWVQTRRIPKRSSATGHLLHPDADKRPPASRAASRRVKVYIMSLAREMPVSSLPEGGHGHMNFFRAFVVILTVVAMTAAPALAGGGGGGGG